MDPTIQTTLNHALLSSIPVALKTVGPWLIILVILGIVIAVLDAKLDKKAHEGKWKTKEMIDLLKTIKENTSKNQK